MSDASPSLRLDVRSPGSESAPDGATTIKILGDAIGHLTGTTDQVGLTVALPALSVTEQRWVLDHAVRRVAAMFPIGDVSLGFDADIPADTALTLSLDRHLATKGELTIAGDDTLIERVAQAAAALDVYRGWVDEDPTTRTSLAIARDVTAWAATRDDVEVRVLEEEELASEGLRLHLAVGGASRISPPRLVVARYKAADPRPPKMLLGKGITFDSGGINVKPYESFVSMMKNDMAGAALAWSLFQSLVTAGVDEPLLCVLGTCENPVGEEAMRPGSIVKSYRGHDVRIDHTDAEGRLVLADALAWATDQYQPASVMSFATLTTSALTAYGPYATPVHFADPDTRAALATASAALGEDLHFFPERLWHFEANRDAEADLRNTARLPGHASRAAGSRNAGHFLKHFTDVPLVHLDIFASTWNWAGDAPGAGYGATGAPLRTLMAAFGALGE